MTKFTLKNMTTLANVSEVRTKLTPFIQQVKQGNEVVLLKNGKPLIGLIDYDRLQTLKELEKEKQQELLNKQNNKRLLLKAIDNVNKQSQKKGIAKKWLEARGYKEGELTEKETLTLIANEY
jgi:prevent-host-death family protein